MAELHNPLFEDEKEFLERKKLEYERALRGDVDHIKDQSVAVGKVALAGAGLAGGIWLLSKLFGGRKKRKHTNRRAEWDGPDGHSHDGYEDHAGEDPNAEYYTDGMGKRHQAKQSYKSAQASARAFMADGGAAEAGDRFHMGRPDALDPAADKYAVHSLSFEEDDPFQAMPYDDSRRMPESEEFDFDDDEDEPRAPARRPNMIGSVLQSFLQSDTGKMLVAQAAAVVLTLVTKKVSEFFPAPAAAPTDKNSDLAAASAVAPAAAGVFYPETAPASSDAPSSSHQSV